VDVKEHFSGSKETIESDDRYERTAAEILARHVVFVRGMCTLPRTVFIGALFHSGDVLWIIAVISYDSRADIPSPAKPGLMFW